MKKENYIVLQIQQEDGMCYNAQVSTSQLRELLAEAKKDAKQIKLNIQIGEKSFEIPMNISDLRKYIKKAELTSNLVIGGLTSFLVDLTQKLSQKDMRPISGRDDEIEKIWFYLSQKTRNNVFLIGKKEVGKTAIAYEIARQIATNECPKEFYDTRVLMLRPELILNIKSNSSFELAVKKLLKFLKKHKDDIILYIDNALYMKTDELLILTLYACLKKWNVPVILTSSEEIFVNYFLNDLSISKYVNKVYVDEPELYELEPMINTHISRLKKKYGIKITNEVVKYGIYTSLLDDSVSANPGKTINTFERAFLEAKRKDKEWVDKECILSCYDSYLKLYRNTTEEEKRKTAYHETGHYLLFVMSPHIDDLKIACVSILPMMNFLGVTWPYRLMGKNSGYSKEYFIDSIAVDLAGRVAEAQVSKEYTTGASQDLESASTIAENVLMAYGLSDADDLKNRCYLEDGCFVKDYLISDEKKKRLDEEVQKLINEGFERAQKVINENKELLSIIAEKLMEEEILTGEQLEKICQDYKK